MTGEEYMSVLAQRRDAWEAEHPHTGPQWLRPLLEWFIRPGDEALVELPVPAPQVPRTARPRTYRSEQSLREERDRVAARLAALTAPVTYDPAVVNLTPTSRSRAARTAGRRRGAALDRQITAAVALQQRLTVLDGRIALARDRDDRSAS